MTAVAVLVGLALAAAAFLAVGLYADHRTDRTDRKHRSR